MKWVGIHEEIRKVQSKSKGSGLRYFCFGKMYEAGFYDKNFLDRLRWYIGKKAISVSFYPFGVIFSAYVEDSYQIRLQEKKFQISDYSLSFGWKIEKRLFSRY